MNPSESFAYVELNTAPADWVPTNGADALSLRAAAHISLALPDPRLMSTAILPLNAGVLSSRVLAFRGAHSATASGVTVASGLAATKSDTNFLETNVP